MSIPNLTADVRIGPHFPTPELGKPDGWNSQTTQNWPLTTTEQTSGGVRVSTTRDTGGFVPPSVLPQSGETSVEVGPTAGDTRVVMGDDNTGSVSTTGSGTLNQPVGSYHHESASLPPSEHDRTVKTSTVAHPGMAGSSVTTKTVDGTTITSQNGSNGPTGTVKVAVGRNDDVDVQRNTDGSVDITVNGEKTHFTANQAREVVIESHGA